MDQIALGRVLVVGGMTLTVIGLALIRYPRMFAWFGHLPGDRETHIFSQRVRLPLVSLVIVLLFCGGLYGIIHSLIAVQIRPPSPR
jgi:hypothetical protein